MQQELLDKSQPFLSKGNVYGKEQCLFGLNIRITKALVKMGLIYPTLIQAKTIPLAMKGLDVLLQSKTGSGKTIAYMAPVLNTLILKEDSKALILLPSKDLVSQVYKIQLQLSKFADVSSVNVCSNKKKGKTPTLEIPSNRIVFGTPGAVLKLLKGLTPKQLSSFRESLAFFVVDEADLIFEFGNKDDISEIVSKFLPQKCQRIMVSATLSAGLKKSNEKDSLQILKSMILVKPVKISLNLGEQTSNDYDISNITQFFVYVDDAAEKDLLLYVLLKLGLINGKILMFVNGSNETFRFQLLLEHFGVKRSVVLNRLFPAKERATRVSVFNRALTDIVIAEDDPSIDNGKHGYNISRGIDFQGIKFVLNVDAPSTVEQYIHRVGRTARGGMSGTSLTIINKSKPDEIKLLKDLQKVMPKKTVAGELVVQPNELKLNKEDLLPFKYRVNDIRYKVTKTAIEARKVKDLKIAMLNVEDSPKQFQQNLRNVAFIASDKAKPKVTTTVLKSRELPEYLTSKLGTRRVKRSFTSNVRGSNSRKKVKTRSK